jgi:AcrR family transcriptional regulator
MDAMLEAAQRVVSQEGVDKLTTTRIADLAGVSIGTVYQYFSNRDEILAAVAQRAMDGYFVQFEKTLDAARAAPIEEVVSAVLHGSREFLRQARVQAALYQAIHELGLSEALSATFARYVDLLTQFLTERQGDLVIDDPARWAFLIFHGVEGIVRAIAQSTPGSIDEAAYLQTVGAIIVQQLVGRPPPSAQ